MPLFVARHQHPAERSPAQDPAMGRMLLDHLAAPSATRHGVTIHGEGVPNDQHTFYLIAEAADQTGLEAYPAPFGQAGSVEVWPASFCAAVIDRGDCGQTRL